MKQKLFSIFFALALLLPANVIVANVNITVKVNGGIGGSVTGTYYSSRTKTGNFGTITSETGVTKSHYSGKTVTLNATASSGYRFVCWLDNNGYHYTGADLSGTVSATTTYTAYFIEDPYVFSWTENLIACEKKDALTSTTDMWKIQFSPTGAANACPILQLMIPTATGGGYNYGNVKGPKPGTYKGTTGTDYNSYQDSKWVNNSSYASMSYVVDFTHPYTFSSGDIIIEQGLNGYPYIKVDGVLTSSNAYFSINMECGERMPYTITASSNNDDMGEVGGYWGDGDFVNGASIYTDGSYVELYAFPREGYYFTGWSDGETSPVYAFEVSSNKTVTANFVKADFTFRMNTSDITVTKVGPKESYYYAYTITDRTKDGSEGARQCDKIVLTYALNGSSAFYDYTNISSGPARGFYISEEPQFGYDSHSHWWEIDAPVMVLKGTWVNTLNNINYQWGTEDNQLYSYFHYDGVDIDMFYGGNPYTYSWVFPNDDGSIYIEAYFKNAAGDLIQFLIGYPGYSVTLNNQSADVEGTSSVQVTVGENENLTSSITVPERTGYKFGGYYTQQNGGGVQLINADGSWKASVESYTDADKKWLYEGPLTLYAKWTQTVTLNQNDATTEGTTSVTATYNGTIGSIANNPAKTGYDFGGWYADNDASGSQIINTSGVLQSSVTNWTDANSKWIHAGASTLYAKWTQTITLNKNGGTNDGTVTVTYNANTTTSFSAVTGIPIGYSAEGYYDAAADGNKIFNADGTLVSYSSAVSSYLSSYGKWNHNGVAPIIYAQFTPNTNTNYTVKHWQQNLADNDYTEVTGDRQQLQGTTDDATAAEAKKYTGFTAQSFDQETIAGNGSTVVNIYYNRDTYTVNLAVSPAGYGSVSPSAAITGVRYGTVITTGTGENANKVTINKTVVTANPAATTAEYTYTFDNWINGTATVTGSGLTVTANFTRTTNTYDIVWKSEDGTSTLETDNAQAYGTPTAYNGATTPTKTVTGYTYTFDGWTTKPNDEGTFYANGATPTVSGAATYYAHFTGTVNTHTLTWVSNGGTLTGGTAAGTTAYGTALTAPTATRAGYTFNGWSPSVPATMPDDNATYTAQWNRIEYTITYEGLNGATNSNPTSYNIESETITLADPGTRDGYVFAGWIDEDDNAITQIAKGSTGDLTLTAIWNVKSSDITLCENCDNDHYDDFKTDYDRKTVNVTYPRQFSASKWSTMCLPFSLDLATMIANKMYGCVYEFKYATGDANIGSGVNLYFSNAKSIEAGKCYIVNANAELAAKTSFVFSGVTIDLSKDNGAALDSEDDYDDLPGYKSQGTIELVGTLRNGTLKGSATGNTYMGLKNNKIYYPNTTAPGSTIWAYRGIFRSSEILDKESMQKMRIIVDGEDRGEIIIDADGDILAPSDAQSRKFIRDGVLYIEREGIIYDAQGKRIK